MDVCFQNNNTLVIGESWIHWVAVNLNRKPEEEASQEEECDKEDKESPFTK